MSELSGIRAIVVDTNAFSRGRLDLDLLETLVARADNHGAVEIWIPEIVLWEWAEHLHQDHVEAVDRLSALRTAGVDVPDLSAESVEVLLEELTTALMPWDHPCASFPSPTPKRL